MSKVIKVFIKNNDFFLRDILMSCISSKSKYLDEGSLLFAEVKLLNLLTKGSKFGEDFNNNELL